MPAKRPLLLTPIEWLVVVGIVCLAVSIWLPTRYRGEWSPTLATASRLRQIGMLVMCYVEDHGAMPDSNAALRSYEPNLPYDVVFCFDDAVAPLLRLTEGTESDHTPCIWFAPEFDRNEPSRQIAAIKRVDFGDRRDRIIVLYGDLSVKYFTTADVDTIVKAVRQQAAERDDVVEAVIPAPPAAAP